MRACSSLPPPFFFSSFLFFLTFLPSHPLPFHQHMDRLQICSLNVRSLNVSEKHSKVLYQIHKKQVHLLLLQETHFKTDHVPQISNKYYKSWYHSTNPLSKSRGVSIGIHKSLLYTLLVEESDVGGRFSFLKLSICNTVFTIANLSPQSESGSGMSGDLEEAGGFLGRLSL